MCNLSKKAVLSLPEDRLMKLKTTGKEQFLNMSYLKEFPEKFTVGFIKQFYEEQLKLNKSY